ncbi:hypothetical protein FRC10_002781 [Ceratobasidium sp. 414]|nr:hypothetical protein FRC10_002781 [Ceratobasidium sp. 414]
MASVPTILAIVAPWVGSVAMVQTVVRPGTGAMGEGAVQITKTGATTRVVAERTSNVARAEAAASTVGNWGVARSVKPVLVPPLARIPVTRYAQTKHSAVVTTGYICYRDAAGNAKCRDPNPPEPDTTSTTIVVQTTEVVTQTYQVTQTQVLTRTFQASSSSASRATSSATATQTGTTLASEIKTNVGEIAGGAAAGVVAIVVLILAIVLWYRQKAIKASTAGAQPDYPAVPPNANQYNPAAGAVPPTPNSGDPFLPPMNQHQNLSVSRFNPTPGSPAMTAPSINSGTGPYSASHYSGLPEPQQNAMSRSAAPTPIPQHDPGRPRPLPMTVEHSQLPQTPSTRQWSGYAQPSGANLVPYAESNNSQPSGSMDLTNNGWGSPPQARNASPLHTGRPGSSAGAAGSPSATYQYSPYMAHSPLGSPPRSPPLPEVYGGMADGGSGGGGLPTGTTPPVDEYGPEEKRVYVRYQ